MHRVEHALNLTCSTASDQDKCVIAHRTTNYELWAQTTTPYVIHYEYMYEPYILIDKTAAPWYGVECEETTPWNEPISATADLLTRDKV